MAYTPEGQWQTITLDQLLEECLALSKTLCTPPLSISKNRMERANTGKRLAARFHELHDRILAEGTLPEIWFAAHAGIPIDNRPHSERCDLPDGHEGICLQVDTGTSITTYKGVSPKCK